jgi:hypothetical protein
VRFPVFYLYPYWWSTDAAGVNRYECRVCAYCIEGRDPDVLTDHKPGCRVLAYWRKHIEATDTESAMERCG